MNNFYRSLLIVFMMALVPFIVHGQESTPKAPLDGPVYIVQSGDNLTTIALRFNISVDELMAANDLANANQIFVGSRLVIPGLGDIKGVLQTEIVAYGDSLKSLSRRNQIPIDMLRKLNRITSPTELYAGVSLVLLQLEEQPPSLVRTGLAARESLLELAVRQGTDPWQIQDLNSLPGTWSALAGEAVYSLTGTSDNLASGLPPVFKSVEVAPLPLAQGRTAIIRADLDQEAVLGGFLVDQPLEFFNFDNGEMVALQGIHAMLDPGLYPLQIFATLPDGSRQSFEQLVVIRSSNYPRDPVLIVDPETLDPANTEPENERILELVSGMTPNRAWKEPFSSPAYFPDCFTSRFGNRRSYNNGPYEYFHSGLDFCGGEGLAITSPAPGTVIFAGLLPVRGNATIIDHGWGVYSGFWHQSKILVQVGQAVSTGEEIGLVGATGRVTGAHLHWEVWVNGIQVDPLDWLARSYP